MSTDPVREVRGECRITSSSFRLNALSRIKAGPLQIRQSGRDPRIGGDPHRVDLAEIPELRAFLRDGKLVQIPRNRSKRLLLLDYLAQLFNPGQHYTEVEVNKALGAVHSDFAALRRYLVDDGFLDRESGQYWRSGGTVT